MSISQLSLPICESHFVVHKHHATRLHYDLRLECGGKLLDWAIPKGPSTNPRHHRLAIRCRDHDKRCLDIEATIPEGRYGAGQLLMWDRGVFIPDCNEGFAPEETLLKGLQIGHIRFTLMGQKLKGAWTLERFRGDWLLTKDQDEFASETDILKDDSSVLTGKRLNASSILWVELLRFYAEDGAQPMVVVRNGFVLDANRSASKRGIRTGIPANQAKAILQGGTFKVWRQEEYEARSRAWLDQCVDFSGVIEPADQHAAWIDLSLHPSPLDVAERMIRTLTMRTGLKISYGAAPSKWIACLAAEHGDYGLAMRDPKAFLSSLPVSELLPVAPEHRERLRFLGYPRIGGVAALPLATLQAQFGQDGLQIHSASKGVLTQGVQAVYPPKSIAESFVFDGEVDSLEAIHDACKALAARVGERLMARSSQSGKLRVTLELEDGQLKPLSRTFTKVLRCPRSVHSALRLLVEPALTAPIASIRVFIPDLEQVRQFQPSLIDGASSQGSPRVEAAMRHVRTVFGDKSVQLGTEIELPRRRKVLREWKNATGWR